MLVLRLTLVLRLMPVLRLTFEPPPLLMPTLRLTRFAPPPLFTPPPPPALNFFAAPPSPLTAARPPPPPPPPRAPPPAPPPRFAEENSVDCDEDASAQVPALTAIARAAAETTATVRNIELPNLLICEIIAPPILAHPARPVKCVTIENFIIGIYSILLPHCLISPATVPPQPRASDSVSDPGRDPVAGCSGCGDAYPGSGGPSRVVPSRRVRDTVPLGGSAVTPCQRPGAAEAHSGG